jgi:hypothetical protein
MKRTRYFHEDDYRQQELLPISSWGYCTSEIEKIDEFSEAHRAPIGWTAVYARGESPARLRDLQLSPEEIESVVSSRLPRYDEVVTGYSSRREPSPTTRAFGLDAGVALFVELNEQGHVEAAWFDPHLADAGVAKWIPALLASLPRAADMLFVDWAWGHLQQVADSEAWASYFGAQARARREIDAARSRTHEET